MEELIEILINLIASFFQNKAIKTVKPPAVPARAVPPVRAEPPSRAPVTAKMPPARKGKRRQSPPMIAVAQPIITTASNVTPPMVPMVRSTITANTGIHQPNQTPSQSAESIRKWLTPATLKHQFLLSEILQQPLALRDHR